MSFRFIRRKKLFPGLNLNLSKSGGSLSFGPRGAKLTVGTGGVRKTLGIPGTGLYYTETGSKRKKKEKDSSSEPLPPSAGNRLNPGFFKRLFIPQGEEDFVDGLRSFVNGNEDEALEYLEKSSHIADAALMAGFIFLKRGKFREAISAMKKADSDSGGLCRYFSKYGIQMRMTMPITDEVSAHITPGRRSLLLGMVEAYQGLGEYGRGIAVLEELLRLSPADPVIKLSLAELLLEENPGNTKACRRVAELAAGIRNESSIHAALMLYHGKALRSLKLFTAARDILTAAYRRKKNRSRDLLLAIRYERALVYRDLGKRSRFRSELEGIFAEEPGYEDVDALLGLEE